LSDHFRVWRSALSEYATSWRSDDGINPQDASNKEFADAKAAAVVDMKDRASNNLEFLGKRYTLAYVATLTPPCAASQSGKAQDMGPEIKSMMAEWMAVAKVSMKEFAGGYKDAREEELKKHDDGLDLQTEYASVIEQAKPYVENFKNNAEALFAEKDKREKEKKNEKEEAIKGSSQKTAKTGKEASKE
jgi:hypothetical protein